MPPKATPKDGEELLRELYKQNLLTKFQAQQFAQGRDKALILGNYTILDKIGAGGMGQVFKAEHRRMHRLVAIKMLPSDLTKDATALARFEREVTAAAKLRHPNIVAADDADEANGVHFLVMEHVEGKDLSVLVKKNGTFSVAKAVNYILQAARGLEFAHSKGVIHRDIKPANLLLGNDGVLKILDMGLARLDHPGGDTATQAELTGTGAVMGTVDYMAPEQALNTKHADHRADIYSLGITLWYLIAGKSAYDGETLMEKLMAHQMKPIPSLKDIQASVPDSVQAIFSKMVAKKKEDRYQSMTEVIADLERCQASLSSSNATVKTSSSPDCQESEMTAAFGNRLLQSIPLPEPEPEVKSGSMFSRPALLGLLAAGLLGVVILAAVLIKMQTKDGTLIVEVDQPDAVVQVLDSEGKVEISQKGGVGKITINVDAGKHRLKVEKDGFAVFGQEFELEKGGKKEITAKLEPNQPAQVAVVSGTVEPASPASPPPIAKAPFDAAQAHAYQAAWAKHLGTKVESKNSVGMTLVLIPPGEFLMGSTPEQIALGVKIAQDAKLKPSSWEWGRIVDEGPQHHVTLTNPYLLGKTEVTIGQFKAFVEVRKYVTEAEQFGFGNSLATTLDASITPGQKKMTWLTPGYAVTMDFPVTQVTWGDAVQFCNWLSSREKLNPCYAKDGTATGSWILAAEGNGYRLPTEAEWEYACRAGTSTQFSFGDDPAQLEQFGWYEKNSNESAWPVGLKLPNAFSLFDMHGNVSEWCHDLYARDYYSTSPLNNPINAVPNSDHVVRGGTWWINPIPCRSAFRDHSTPKNRTNNRGFRVVRVAVNVPSKPDAPFTPGGQPIATFNDPGFQAWMKGVQTLPAEKQVEAVSKKLVELNPGFDGRINGWDNQGTPKIENGVVTVLGIVTDNVTDISPVRALAGLRTLNCSGSSDGKRKLSDLSPLQGMKLATLYCGYTNASDLSPLRGMPLTTLGCSNSPISDLSPLEGMPLKYLFCSNSPLSDLTPLGGMTLAEIQLTPKNIAKGLDAIRQMKSLTAIGISLPTKFPPDEFWKKYDAGEFGKPITAKPLTDINDPAFQQWMKEVAALPAEKQIEAVSKKLMELNPSFDGKVTGIGGQATPKVESGLVTELNFCADNVTDISPVRALAALKKLGCSGGDLRKRANLSDLSPLVGMKLTKLACGWTQVSDLSPLIGMRLTELLIGNSTVSDLSLLHGMPLTFLDCGGTSVPDFSPLKGMPLTSLWFPATKITDLGPLRGMPLTELKCAGTPVSDLSSLQNCTSLRSIYLHNTKVTPAGVAALQNALPNCKIDWDGAAKLAYLDPAFQQWVAETQKLTAEQQIEAVSKKMMELNPGFDGKVTGADEKGPPKIEDGVVTEFGFATDTVTDISPVRALVGLKVLHCDGSLTRRGILSDLSPLRGMKTTHLTCPFNPVSDLSPLQEMKLTKLVCSHTMVSDLSPLVGMPLTYLGCGETKVSNLSPLQGMPLKTLTCYNNTQLVDLSPLHTCKTLRTLMIDGTKTIPSGATAAGIAALQKALPDCKIGWPTEGKFYGQPDSLTKPITSFNDPAFQQWVKVTQALPAEQQIEAVSKKLMELNPGFDGKVTGWNGTGTPRIENGVVTELGLFTDNVTDISPIRALANLKVLKCNGSGPQQGILCDLSPLTGMTLTKLDCGWCPGIENVLPLEGMPLAFLACNASQIVDITPLMGMPLTTLRCDGTKVFDLSALKGSMIENLNCYATRISDLSPLKGKPLKNLICPNTQVSDLSALKDCKSLTRLDVTKTKVTSATVAALQKALPNCKIEWDDPTKAATAQPNHPWNTPAFQAWMKEVQAMPAEKQIEAVSKKLMELNPGFDGVVVGGNGKGTPEIVDGVVTSCGFSTLNVTDLSPVQAFVKIKVLACCGNRHGGALNYGKLADISPLRGINMTSLNVSYAQVSDLSALQGMPLTVLNCNDTQVSDLSVLQGMPLRVLVCGTTKVSDLSALQGMPLTVLNCNDTQVSDLTPLHECQNLNKVNVARTKVTPAQVAALQKALPNCKIEWDDPAKPKTPEPTDSGTK